MIARSMADAMKRAGRVHALELAAGLESELTCMNIMCERVGSPCACRLALCLERLADGAAPRAAADARADDGADGADGGGGTGGGEEPRSVSQLRAALGAVGVRAETFDGALRAARGKVGDGNDSAAAKELGICISAALRGFVASCE